MIGSRNIAIVSACALAFFGATAPGRAQMHGGEASAAAPYGSPVADQHVWIHAVLEQFEYRAGDGAGDLVWDGQAWIGTDSNRLWLKSEGSWHDGSLEHGKHEVLYDRPISTYFDLQAGIRLDADSKPGRGWAAFGIQGLAPYFFEVSATAYASDRGRLAANFEGSFDLLLTQQLILQPQLEFDLYSKSDSARRVGSGLAEIETGLRLRYEISRKFAPYFGVSYQRSFGQTRRFAIADGEDSQTLHFVIGIRSWL
jgi:copper resistance protein B